MTSGWPRQLWQQGISTHTPSWGVTALSVVRPFFYDFYSHALVGRDSNSFILFPKSFDFYSHALVGRDLSSFAVLNIDGDFYSHALVGRDKRVQRTIIMNFNFYSHALVGRDDGITRPLQAFSISTHTPSWGVTVSFGLTPRCAEFLLTRPRGA